LPGLDIHTGIWRALTELEIFPTANAGTSAGAIMAAFCSAGIAQSGIERMLRSLSDSDVRAERFAWKIRAPWIDWFLENAPIRKILEAKLPDRFYHLEKPLSVVATRVRDGRQTIFSGDPCATTSPRCVALNAQLSTCLTDAVLASMSISGVFPHVNILGEDYADGGVRANLPLPTNWRNYDEIYLLIASRPVEYTNKHGILACLMLNLDWYALDQIEDTVALLAAEYKKLRGPRVHIVWPAIGRDAGALRFRHELIDQAYQQTLQQFKGIRNAT